MRIGWFFEHRLHMPHATHVHMHDASNSPKWLLPPRVPLPSLVSEAQFESVILFAPTIRSQDPPWWDVLGR